MAGTQDYEQRRGQAGGTIAQWAEDLTRIADLGVDHVFLDITAPIDDQIEAMRQLVLNLTTVV